MTIFSARQRLHIIAPGVTVRQWLPVGAAASWTPAQPTTDGGVSPLVWEVPGVENYQDAAKTTPAGVGDVVGAVVNQGSDTHDIVQATTASKPTLQEVTVNSVTGKVWRFDGTDDFLQGAFGGGAISQPYTVFAVAQLDATAVNDSAEHKMIDGDDNANRAILYKSGANVWAVYAGSVRSDGVPNANWNIWTALFSGASTQLWHNGISLVTGNAGTAALDGLTVGERFTPGQPWKGDIGPILIYAGNLSTADKNEIGEYLETVTGIAWTTIV